MIRLQRVTFLALHDYLGLTTELTRSADELAQRPPIHRTHKDPQQHPKLKHQHSVMHTKSVPNAMTVSNETLNNALDDLVNKENPRLSRSTSTTSYTSPSSDQTQTVTPEVSEHKNEFEALITPTTTDRTISVSIPMQKRTATFAGHRSMSVVESRNLKPDFEEAAARARVKNSLDTTFFEKHKISYPNVSNNRTSNSSAARRRSSFSDVSARSPWLTLALQRMFS